MRDDRPGAGQHRDLARVDVPGVRREQSGAEEVVLVEVGRRPNAVIALHELELGTTLVQMDRVADVVRLGEGADGLQEFR